MHLVASSYHLPPATVRRMPLAQLWAFYYAALAAEGREPGGPTYVEREMIQAMRKARKKGSADARDHV